MSPLGIKTMTDKKTNVDFGVGVIFKGLDDLLDAVGVLAEKGEEFKKKVKNIQEKLTEKAQSLGGEVSEKAQKELSKIEQLRERGRKAAKFFLRQPKRGQGGKGGVGVAGIEPATC